MLASESAHGNAAPLQYQPTPAPQVTHLKLTHWRWWSWGTGAELRQEKTKKFHFVSCWLLPPSFINTKHQVYMKQIKVKRRTHWGARRIFKIQQDMHFALWPIFWYDYLIPLVQHQIYIKKHQFIHSRHGAIFFGGALSIEGGFLWSWKKTCHWPGIVQRFFSGPSENGATKRHLQAALSTSQREADNEGSLNVQYNLWVLGIKSSHVRTELVQHKGKKNWQDLELLEANLFLEAEIVALPMTQELPARMCHLYFCNFVSKELWLEPHKENTSFS